MLIKLLIFIIVIVLFDIYFETNITKINFIKIKSKKPLPEEGFKIMQITDFHNFSHYERILKLVRQSNPHIIAVTGDLVDMVTKDYRNVYRFMEELIKINSNVYYVPGNHELKNGGMKEIIDGLKDRNVKVLLNENQSFNAKGYKINICGLDYSSKDSYNLLKALNVPDKNSYTVMLSHKPDIVNKYSKFNCDLIICGHTHGGQIRLPILGALIAPDQGMLPKYNKGLYTVGANTLLYIDSGVGTTRIPIRLFNRSQVSLITIEN